MLSADGQVGTYSRTPGYSGDFSSDGDDIDLRWEIISQKLKKAGYHNYWYGKGKYRPLLTAVSRSLVS